MKKIIIAILVVVVAAVYWSQRLDPTGSNPYVFAVVDENGKPTAMKYAVPDDKDILNHENSEQIFYGKRLLNETKRLLPDNVGAAMNCNSCHLYQGKLEYGDPYINTYNAFPQFNPRAERVVTLEERINGCFQRSMNGTPLPEQSDEMKAIIAYYKWLAQDVPHGWQVVHQNTGPIDTSLQPNMDKGEEIYGAMCASCHGDNGEGMWDASGNIMFPPLWGDDSFNIGAGMARLYKAAAFVKYNMPMGYTMNRPQGQGHVLTDQEAVDVSYYFTQKPRPDFPAKVNDWPSGKKPKDSRY